MPTQCLLSAVDITVAELRQLVLEVLAETLPNREEVEASLAACKVDDAMFAKLMLRLEARFPLQSRLHLQTLARAAKQWRSGSAGFGDVITALDRLYASVILRRRPMTLSGRKG